MILKTSGTAEPRDPWVVYEDGYFYHCFANRAGDIFVAKSQTAEGLATALPAPHILKALSMAKKRVTIFFLPLSHVMTKKAIICSMT